MNYIKHVTQQGERWDTIAWRYYRDQYAWTQIAVANPTIPIRAELPEGLHVAVPVIAKATTALNLLPPWKRAALEGSGS